ncbi:MAG: GNAT family N-acetyltransferase, partial [Actinomycetota bacterium]|nr:GNAT family N-acetyltransferase [Actinomycetota bacterium]
MTPFVISPEAPASAAGREVLRAYFNDVVGRYLGRAATAGEVDAAMRDDPSDDLAVLLVAWRDGVALGCSGLRLLGHGTGEIKRVFVRAQARRLGVGSALLRELEAAARRLGVTTLRLDTRHDLVEARSFY